MRQAPQLRIDHRHELVEGDGFTVAPRQQQPRDVVPGQNPGAQHTGVYRGIRRAVTSHDSSSRVFPP
jgi:hypothetical protein